MSDELDVASLCVFDAWEPIEKARKPKGLQNWSRLSHIADKLEGKSSKDISFTTSYPGQEGRKKILGSIEGNLHFLMGYANPGFHLAEYHWQIIDPNLSDEEASELNRVKGHPSRSELWGKSGLTAVVEGDEEAGAPHADFVVTQKDEESRKELLESSMYVPSGAGTYVAVPPRQVIIDADTTQIYRWPLVKDSMFGFVHTEVAQRMDEARGADTSILKSMKNEEFADEVYPFVKSIFPLPGSAIPLETDTTEIVYGITTPSSVRFVDREGLPVSLRVFGREYTSFDLVKGGDVHPSVVLSFAVEALGVDPEFIHKGIADSLKGRETEFGEAPSVE
jgi:hypothetical protein